MTLEMKLEHLVPPLKDHPEVIESEESEGEQESDGEQERGRTLQFKIEDFKCQWALMDGCFKKMKSVFIKLGVLKNKWSLKKPEDEIMLSDYIVTDQSLNEKFENVFGENSRILGKCIYILISCLRDNISFNFMEFIKLFTGLIVSKLSKHNKQIVKDANKKERNKVVF